MQFTDYNKNITAIIENTWKKHYCFYLFASIVIKMFVIFD